MNLSGLSPAVTQARFRPEANAAAVRDERDGLQASLESLRDVVREMSQERAALFRELQDGGCEAHVVAGSGGLLLAVRALVQELGSARARLEDVGARAGEALSSLEAAAVECVQAHEELSRGVSMSPGAEEPAGPAAPATPASGLPADGGAWTPGSVDRPQACESPSLPGSSLSSGSSSFERQAASALRASRALLDRLGMARASLSALGAQGLAAGAVVTLGPRALPFASDGDVNSAAPALTDATNRPGSKAERASATAGMPCSHATRLTSRGRNAPSPSPQANARRGFWGFLRQDKRQKHAAVSEPPAADAPDSPPRAGVSAACESLRVRRGALVALFRTLKDAVLAGARHGLPRQQGQHAGEPHCSSDGPGLERSIDSIGVHWVTRTATVIVIQYYLRSFQRLRVLGATRYALPQSPMKSRRCLPCLLFQS